MVVKSTLIRAYVTPNAKQASVVKVSEDYFEVWVDERAAGAERTRDFWRFWPNTSKSQNQESSFQEEQKQETKQSK